jgi:hypothetical protein
MEINIKLYFSTYGQFLPSRYRRPVNRQEMCTATVYNILVQKERKSSSVHLKIIFAYILSASLQRQRQSKIIYMS